MACCHLSPTGTTKLWIMIICSEFIPWLSGCEFPSQLSGRMKIFANWQMLTLKKPHPQSSFPLSDLDVYSLVIVEIITVSVPFPTSSFHMICIHQLASHRLGFHVYVWKPFSFLSQGHTPGYKSHSYWPVTQSVQSDMADICNIRVFLKKYCRAFILFHHHHHVVPLARISLTLSRHFSLSFIASWRSSGLHPVSSHSCCMYVRAIYVAV